MVVQQGKQDICSRDELHSYLEKNMQRSYEQLSDRGKVESGTSFVKSFLLECDWNPQQLETSDASYLCDLLSVKAEGRKRKVSDATIVDTNESGFYIVNWTWNDVPITLYLDTISDSNRRFWRAYSLSNAQYLDDILHRLIDSKNRLDRTWLWSSLLKSIQQEGEPRGFRLEHDSSLFQEENNEPFSLKFSGDDKRSELILDLMNKSEELAPQTSLANVRMKYPRDHSGDFAIETVYYNGKLTSTGNSFAAHQTVLDCVQNVYSNKIYQIESDYTILTTSDETKWDIKGSPIIFDFSRSEIANVDSFCKVVFSGKMPFKLWGTPRSTYGQEGRTVRAVDLHSGAKLFFEIYPDIICMYLYRGSCGNAAIRFYTNLQMNFSRLVDAQDESGNQFF